MVTEGRISKRQHAYSVDFAQQTSGVNNQMGLKGGPKNVIHSPVVRWSPNTVG